MLFQLLGRSESCREALTARRFIVDLTNEAKERLAFELARAYVPPSWYSQYPTARTQDVLPSGDKVRKGDFGEFITHKLYEQIFGHEIPFSRLWGKKAPDATQHGADTVSVLIDPVRGCRPFTAETKLRTGPSRSSELLNRISGSVASGNSNTYLAAAWQAGISVLDAHQGARKAYAHSAAQHLALLDGTDPDDLPQYERHAVIIIDETDVKRSIIEKHWATPPVSTLSVIKIEGLNDFVTGLYEAAGRYTAGQLADTTKWPPRFPPIEDDPISWAGLGAPLDSTTLAQWVASNPRPHPAIEGALWYLAEHDGIAQVRVQTARDDRDPMFSALVQLLLGDVRGITLAELDRTHPIQPLVAAVTEVWASPNELEADRRRIVAAARIALDATTDLKAQMAISLTAEAICYRLARQPSRIFQSGGIIGSRVMQVAKSLRNQGIQALWPSQSKCLDAGLLASPQRSFVLRVPTSGGKTTLIALAAANALDHRPGSRVVVIAPSRALVDQMQSVLDQLLGTVTVSALHGETELDDAMVDHRGDWVTVMTPERFDLDWRRAATIEELDPMEQSISAVLVDEAHYIADSNRGARLELALSRVLRHGIPVTLASSQLGPLEELAAWIDGGQAESDWQPAHQVRLVYYRQDVADADDKPVTKGFLLDEQRRTEERLTVGRTRRPSRSGVASRKVADQGAAIATQFQTDGPVVLYSAVKKHIGTLVEHLRQRLWTIPTGDGAERLAELADQLPATATAERGLLLAGIGVHHRDVRRQTRRVVEDAARDGALRFLVCTSTLLEGIDLPIRTVVMVYPGRSPGPLSISDLRNLEGRAGRGGQHTSGRIIVFRTDKTAADQALRLFREQLPPTTSQLAEAAGILRRRAEDAELGQLEPFLLAAIAEAALPNGDLRRSLEAVLGRSLCFASLSEVRRDEILAAAEKRARQIRRSDRGDWPTVVYRTGLGMSTCSEIRNRLSSMDVEPFLELGRESSLPGQFRAPTELLGMLFSSALIDFSELGWPTAVSGIDPSDVVAAWLRGFAAESAAESHPNAKVDHIKRAFDAISQQGPWLVGAAIEILGYLWDLDYITRCRIISALGLERLRTGTPSLEAAELVRMEFERDEAALLWAQYEASIPDIAFSEWVKEALAQFAGEDKE